MKKITEDDLNLVASKYIYDSFGCNRYGEQDDFLATLELDPDYETAVWEAKVNDETVDQHIELQYDNLIELGICRQYKDRDGIIVIEKK